MNYLRKEYADILGKIYFETFTLITSYDIKLNPLKPMRPKMDVFNVS